MPNRQPFLIALILGALSLNLSGCIGTKIRMKDKDVDPDAPFPSLHSVPERPPADQETIIQRRQTIEDIKRYGGVDSDVTEDHQTADASKIPITAPESNSETVQNRLERNEKLRKQFGL